MKQNGDQKWKSISLHAFNLVSDIPGTARWYKQTPGSRYNVQQRAGFHILTNDGGSFL